MPILPVIYLSVALCSFASLLKDLQEETDLSSEERQCSLKVIILAATLWPIVVPISYLEKRAKAQQMQLFNRIPEVGKTQAPLSVQFELERDTEKQQEAVQGLAA